jgi:hypothetical protein
MKYTKGLNIYVTIHLARRIEKSKKEEEEEE